MSHITDNHDALLDYLYEEGDPAERLTIARHLQECSACAVAVLEFQNVRGLLSDWTPPGSQLGFRVIREPGLSPAATVDPTIYQDSQAATIQHSNWWSGRRFLQAAAAILIFVSGMAASQVDVEYRDGSVTFHTRPAAPRAGIRDASITLPPETNTLPSTPLDIDEIVRRASAELAQQNVPAGDTERLLQRVRAMIDQSEQRQQRELALRLSQVASEVDTQHQADLLRIQQDFGQQQEATLNYLVKTSGGSK